MNCILAVPDFGVVGIHTTPREAETEIDLLVNVYDNVVDVFDTEVMGLQVFNKYIDEMSFDSPVQ